MKASDLSVKTKSSRQKTILYLILTQDV